MYVNSDPANSGALTPPPSTILEDDWSGLVAGVCQEKIQPLLLSVSPESGEVSFAGSDEEKGKDELEAEVLKKNYSHQVQVEKKLATSSQVVCEESVVDVDQHNQ